MKNKVYYVLKRGYRYYNHNKDTTEITKATFLSSKFVAEFINENQNDGEYKIKKITIIEEVAND